MPDRLQSYRYFDLRFYTGKRVNIFKKAGDGPNTQILCVFVPETFVNIENVSLTY